MSETSTKCPKCGAAIPPEAPQGLCPKCLLQQASFPTETGPGTRHSPPAPPDRAELAKAFPHLEILELIGQGGMGFVYKARQPKLDRVVALKILAQPLAEQTLFAERFTREGRTLAKLNHPNIVTIHDFGQAGSPSETSAKAGPYFYLLMEYVDGVNLRQAMKAGAVNSAQALAIVPRICDALQYAHSEGVLHRDIKPDNILLDARGRVKIADFGIAKLMAEAAAENPLTGSGSSLGTPHYMAPEQIEKPNSVDHRADIYSLGVVFYEMLTGELPLGRFAPPSEKSDSDPRLDEIVFQTLEKQPERRPQSADEVRTRVEDITSAGAPGPREPVTFKMSPCYITNLEFLRTRIGRLLRFTARGELRLDENALTFTPRGNWVVIPLSAITNLTLSEFSIAVGKLKFIALTFTEKGAARRILLVPTQGAFRPFWDTNQHVEEWFAAIRHAVKARTGRIPPSVEDSDSVPSVNIPSPRIPLLKAAVILLTLAIFLWGVLFLVKREKRQALVESFQSATRSAEALTPPPIETAPPVLSPVNGPSKPINISFVEPSKTRMRVVVRTEPAADELFVPVIRYGDGPWGEGAAVTTDARWYRDRRGSIYNLDVFWSLPEDFSSAFELAAAAMRVRDRAARGPIELTTEATSVFELTNSSNQTISGGIRLVKTNLPPAQDIPEASLKKFNAFYNTSGDSAYNFAGYTEDATIPAGYRLEAIAREDGQPVLATSRLVNGLPRFTWLRPTETYSDFNRFNRPFPRLEIRAGAPVSIFAFTNNAGIVYEALIELVALPGMPPVKVSAAPANSINRSTPSAPADFVQLTFFKNKIEPRRITLEAAADLAMDQQVLPILRRPEPTPGSVSSIPSQTQNVWECKGDQPEDRIARFSWSFSEIVSLQQDLVPAVTRFFGTDRSRTIRVPLDQPVSLFTITNALGQVMSCDIQYNRAASLVKDPKVGALVTSGTCRRADTNVAVDFVLACPPGAQILATGIADGHPTLTFATRNLEVNAYLACDWTLPESFRSLMPKPSTNAPGAALPGTRLNPPFMEAITEAINSGDARVTADKPLEIFALTNAENKIFRAFLELKQLQAGAASPGVQQPYSMGSPTSRRIPRPGGNP